MFSTAIDGKALQYDPQPCYLGMCLSDSKYDLNSIMLKKATRAAFALSTNNTASTTTINRLFNQLIEPILLYGVEQWLSYIHPRKVAQTGPTNTFASLNTQLSTKQVWKVMTHSHYSLHTSTPVLGVRAELGAFPTYIPGILRLTKYMAYITDSYAHPLLAKAVITLKAIASKFAWWSNA